MNGSIIAYSPTTRQHSSATPHTATPIATTLCQHLPKSFFTRPAEVFAPDLIGCLLVKCQADGELVWGVIVETEAYCQSEPARPAEAASTPATKPCLVCLGGFMWL